MNKILVTDHDSFVSFEDANTGILPEHGRVVSDFWAEPEKYPCVVVWDIRHDENGPDELYGEFVYLEDFDYDYRRLR